MLTRAHKVLFRCAFTFLALHSGVDKTYELIVVLHTSPHECTFGEIDCLLVHWVILVPEILHVPQRDVFPLIISKWLMHHHPILMVVPAPLFVTVVAILAQLGSELFKFVHQ